MEHENESTRLDLKTDRERLVQQARWAGIRPGMRVADLGCGSGITSSYLYELVQPGGEVVGVDASQERIGYAREQYGTEGISFQCKNLHESLDDLGQFDFIWVRFVLEYHQSRSREMVAHMTRILKPDGILCLVDLDNNSMCHYGQNERLDRAMQGVVSALMKDHDFDPYAGRKLYSYLYSLGYRDIAIEMAAHHLIFGALNGVDAYNWNKKLEVAAKNSGYPFAEYDGGFDEFAEDFNRFFSDPGRFTYTPLIVCRGVKPVP